MWSRRSRQVTMSAIMCVVAAAPWLKAQLPLRDSPLRSPSGAIACHDVTPRASDSVAHTFEFLDADSSARRHIGVSYDATGQPRATAITLKPTNARNSGPPFIVGIRFGKARSGLRVVVHRR